MSGPTLTVAPVGCPECPPGPRDETPADRRLYAPDGEPWCRFGPGLDHERRAAEADAADDDADREEADR